MGLQVPLGVDDEISVPGIGRGCRAALPPGIAEGDCAKQGDGDLRGIDQPGPHSHADRDTTAVVGIASGAASEGEELAQAVIGVCEPAEAVLGSTFVGAGLLGCDERECDRRGMEEIYRGATTAGARR